MSTMQRQGEVEMSRSSTDSFNVSASGATFQISSILNSSLLPSYPKADIICDEVKVSALSKLEQIIEEKHREEEWVTVLEKNEKSAIATSMSFSHEKAMKKETLVLEIDEAAAYRTQLQLLEQKKQLVVQQAILKRLTIKNGHAEEFEIAAAEEAQERLEAWQNAEQRDFAELEAYDAMEKKRTILVNQLHAKRHQEQAKKMDKLIEEAGRTEQIRRDEHRHKQELMDKILTQQQKFRAIFTQISEMLKSFPYREDMIAAVSPSVSTMKGLNEMMETLLKQCKVGEVSQLDLTTAESLVEKLDSGYLSVKNRLDEIKRQKEAEKQKTEIPTPEQESPQVQTESSSDSTASSSESSLTGLEGYISAENLKILTNYQKILEEHSTALKALDGDAKLKKFKFQCQMAVTTPLNAISAVSSSHLRDKLRRLQTLLKGQPVEVSNSRVAASSHPLGILFCTNLLAERIVEQGEQTVSSKPESAYPIAAVTLALMAEFPLFQDLLFAHFFTHCPYLVPYYVPRTANMTDQQYYSAQGYRYNSEGQVEAHDKFLKRMAGTATLYFAILSSKLPRDVTLPPPPTLISVWSWLTSLLNLDPRIDVSATMLLVCLEVAGHAVSAAYPKQFKKLFISIIRNYYPLIKQVSPSGASGAVLRLEVFLQNCAKKSNLPPPAGALPPHFW